MIFLTQKEMQVLARKSAPVLWVRGPAGSGKTFLLIEKAITLAEGILEDHRKEKEKILVLCYNQVLCKALEKKIKSQLPANEDVRSFLHFQTFTTLVKSLACYPWTPKSKEEKEECVNVALENLQTQAESPSGINSMYDHILVDEGQDLFGENWPKLIQHMHKNFQLDKEKSRAKRGVFWVMYDLNQHLYFAKEQADSHFAFLSNSAELNEVLRNTGNVFMQSMKYYESLPDDSPITLGHGLPGLPIEWDDSLVSRSGEEKEGARSVVQWIKKLQNQGVRRRDICILVENQGKQRLLKHEIEEIEGIGEQCQTGDDLVEKFLSCAVLESIRRFKGMESKVVILYNPPFQDDPIIGTKELLYTAMSRCSCLLVVISTKQGCKALKSNVGVNEESRGKRPYTSRLLTRPASVLQSQQQGNVNDADVSRCSLQKSSRSESQQPSGGDDDDDDDDDEDVSFSDLLEISPDQIKKYMYHQKLSEKRAASNEPRPMEVEGGSLTEPGDPNIPDAIRGNAFTLLEEVVQENLKYIPDVCKMNYTMIIAAIEYEAYQKRRAECHSRRYTADLRKLKMEISTCNKKKICHDCVMNALKSATKIRGMVFVEYFICLYSQTLLIGGFIVTSLCKFFLISL